MQDSLEQKAIMLADELVASYEGRRLIKGLIAHWQMKGFVYYFGGISYDSPLLWNHHHKLGWNAAETMKGVLP